MSSQYWNVLLLCFVWSENKILADQDISGCEFMAFLRILSSCTVTKEFYYYFDNNKGEFLINADQWLIFKNYIHSKQNWKIVVPKCRIKSKMQPIYSSTGLVWNFEVFELKYILFLLLHLFTPLYFVGEYCISTLLHITSDVIYQIVVSETTVVAKV